MKSVKLFRPTTNHFANQPSRLSNHAGFSNMGKAKHSTIRTVNQQGQHTFKTIKDRDHQPSRPETIRPENYLDHTLQKSFHLCIPKKDLAMPQF
jgi:hypothetical protein